MGMAELAMSMNGSLLVRGIDDAQREVRARPAFRLWYLALLRSTVSAREGKRRIA